MFWTREDAVIGIETPMDYKVMQFLRFVLRIISGWPGKELGEPAMWFEGMLHAYYNTILSLVYLVSGIAYLRIHLHELNFYELGHMIIVLLMNMLSSSRAFTLCLSTKYRAVAKLFIQKIHLFYHKEKSDFSMDRGIRDRCFIVFTTDRVFVNNRSVDFKDHYKTKIHGRILLIRGDEDWEDSEEIKMGAPLIHKKVHKFSHFFAIYLTVLMLVALCLFNLTPVFNNYKAGKYKGRENLVNATYEHAIYFVFPWNADSNFNGYMVASVINWYGSYLCVSSVCMFDLFLSLMIFNLWGHFKILLRILDTFPKPASDANNEEETDESKVISGAVIYSPAEQEMVGTKLKECIEYHLLIVDFTDKMSDAFGMALFLYYGFHQVSGCLLLLECSQLNADALARFLPLTIIMFQQLIQLSIIFETIGAMSEKLKDAVYCLPWEYMNTQNRKTVFIYLINVQEPIHVNAGGLVSVGVTTMASIIKTSLSYFAFLRTVSV